MKGTRGASSAWQILEEQKAAVGRNLLLKRPRNCCMAWSE